MLNFLLENSFTVVTFKIFFPKNIFRFFANWAIGGAHYTFHENWLNWQNFSELIQKTQFAMTDPVHK